MGTPDDLDHSNHRDRGWRKFGLPNDHGPRPNHYHLI